MANLRGLAEVVLLVGDVQRSLHFYRDILGLTVISPPELKGPVFLQLGADSDGVPSQIVLAPRPANAPEPPAQRAARHVYHFGIEIASADFEAERERLRGLGFEIRTGEHPFLPVEAFYLDDPDGNEVEIVAARASVA